MYRRYLFRAKIFYILFLLSFYQISFAEPYRGVERIKVSGTQHALVVGINEYQSDDLMNLRGAVNDAQLLSSALRQAGVQLPDERILLNAQATRAAFVQAWQNMLKQAKPGDTLIVTFAGHGGQEDDMAPLGEADKKDETLIFHDFKINKKRRSSPQGRITDDELFGLFETAPDYKILVVADACHSSGMVRSTTQPIGRFRSAGHWNIQVNAPPAFPKLHKSSEGKLHPHVTFITAVDTDSLQVPETILSNKPHGALSWFFAEAISGKADGNQNGRLERDELERFLTEKISNHMNKWQKPKLLPNGDQVSVFNLATLQSLVPKKTNINDIAILVQNGTAPKGLKHIRIVNASQTFDLQFQIKGQQTEVFNHTGDKLTTISSATHQWQQLINKRRLLKTLATQFDMRLAPIRINLKEGNGLHKRGSYLHFSILPGNSRENLNALTLFGLGAKGELQFLYPLKEYEDPLKIQRFPYNLPPLTAGSGGEDLVVILCRSPAKVLHQLLARVEPQLPEPEQLLRSLNGYRRMVKCQVGQYAVFSGE